MIQMIQIFARYYGEKNEYQSMLNKDGLTWKPSQQHDGMVQHDEMNHSWTYFRIEKDSRYAHSDQMALVTIVRLIDF